jgi:5-methyltetrahydrofolate--homocysteine methyltransferase
LALENGLDIPIMNPLDKDTMEVVKSYMVLTGKDDKCQNYIDFNTVKEDNSNSETSLFDAIVNGLKEQISAGIEKELTLNDSDHIINNILIPALQEVGNRFEANKIFMPQLIRSAEAAKRAFDILAAEKSSKSSTEIQDKAPVIIATVKGDVHDIGKNIATVVMGCNGYEVFDLGVMVPAERIVAAVLEYRADIVILSGLITPSLDEMITTVKAMKAAGLSIPVMIAGATTSPMHTALKIAPAYDAPVIHVKDVSQNVVVAAELLGGKERYSAFVAALEDGHNALRAQAATKASAPLRSLDDARANRLNLFGE